MLLSEYMTSLVDGELNGINLGHNNLTGASSYNSPELTAYINAGLLDLHTRFSIKQKQIDVREFEDIRDYFLDPKFAVSNPAPVSHPYILDNAGDPFNERPLRIDTVYDSEGCAAKLNEQGSSDRVRITSTNSIHVTKPKNGEILTIHYRAAPNKAKVGCSQTEELDLPMSYMNALTTYVVQKVYSTKTDESSVIKSNQMLGQYQEICRVIEHYGLNTIEKLVNRKLEKNGWV